MRLSNGCGTATIGPEGAAYYSRARRVAMSLTFSPELTPRDSLDLWVVVQ